MKKLILTVVAVHILGFISSCKDTPLKPKIAEKLVKERVEKMPGRSVSFYLGPVTDLSYLPVYKKIATGKYLTLKENIFVKVAGKHIPMFEATKEGKKIFKCEKNRCTVQVCKNEFAGISSTVRTGKDATVTYRVKTVCNSKVYETFKALADKQYIKPETVKKKVNMQFTDKGWVIK